MNILVTGGAGYVGSHIVRHLRAAGDRVTVVDNLETGHRFLSGDATFVNADILDHRALVAALTAGGPFDAVIHCAGLSLVSASIENPAAYRRANVEGTQTLLAAMRDTNHRRIIFSSSAAVYGAVDAERLTEDFATSPVNPYGQTKLDVERALAAAARELDIDSVSLRYFNAAGAHPDGDIGELHDPETHLIPNVLRAAVGSAALKVFGNDYPTPDGTCIRDYVHVCDLALAHRLAVGWLDTHPGAHVFNLGNGSGFSVLEVIGAAERVTGRRIAWELAERRAGDPPRLVADATRARELLGWQPAWTRIDDIIESAWRFHRARTP